MAKIDSFTKPNKEYPSTEKLREEIKDLHYLHSVTKDFNHIIEYQLVHGKCLSHPNLFIHILHLIHCIVTIGLRQLKKVNFVHMQ